MNKEEYREYMREYMRNRYDKRRVEALNLLGGKCVKCGSKKNLEVDHIDRATKTMNFERMAWVSKVRFLEELAKCQLLCKKHHEEKSKTEQSVEHGGGVSGKKNCPCELCRAKRREYSRNYKFNKIDKKIRSRYVKRGSPLERLKNLHGTRAGYLIEVRQGLTKCAACKLANAKYTKELKKRKPL